MINGRLRDFWHSSAINMKAAFGIQVLAGGPRGVAADAGTHLGLMNFRLLSTVCGWEGLFNKTPSARYADDSDAET